jgi:ATP-dependent protease ClpP protease subunit
MKKLLMLAVKNAATPQSIKFENAGESANIYLKGVIDEDFGIGANALREAFAQADGKPVNLYVNSPGGSIFEGREMQAVIANYPGEVTAIIQGVAASAATWVSMAAAKVKMVQGSRYMIHNGMGAAFGGKGDLRSVADLLDSFDTELANEYAARTKAEPATMTAFMDAETWFTADEALKNGFVDEVITNTQNKAIRQAWNLSAYANAPEFNEPESEPEPETLDLTALASAQLQANRNRLRLFQI